MGGIIVFPGGGNRFAVGCDLDGFGGSLGLGGCGCGAKRINFEYHANDAQNKETENEQDSRDADQGAQHRDGGRFFNTRSGGWYCWQLS